MKRSSLLLGLFPMILLSGCLAPGERAQNDRACSAEPCEATCPAGETCSPDTPKGLHFGGASAFTAIFDAGPKRTAVGGTQVIRVSGVDSTGSTFSGPFDAAGTNVIGIENVSPPEVTVRGLGEGSGHLRILEPGTDNLYDRIVLETGVVAKIHAVPLLDFWHDPVGAPSLAWALFAGSTETFGVLLLDAGDKPLVDESMGLDVSGSASGSRDSSHWDLLTVSAGNAGPSLLRATTGGNSFDESLPVVDTLTDILSISADALKPLGVGKERQICFRAIAGELAVTGAPFTLAASGAITTQSTNLACITVKGSAAGAGTLVVGAAGIQRSFPMQVVTSLASEPQSQMAAASPRGPMPGERAR